MLTDIKPFKMYGNLYFVGSGKVSVHIIKTGEGLVMLDTGYPDMYDQILESMAALNLDPKDICAIFHSHGHIDHFGCTMQFKKLSGAKTYISRIDNDILNGTYDLSWAKELNLETLPFFDCDVLIEDGDEFTFGTTKIRCVHTPGHTDGVMSYFVSLKENGNEITAAMHGGAGMNTLKKSWLDLYSLPYDCRDKFMWGISRVMDEEVDLVMGNHPQQNDTEGKLERILQGESILDKTEWKKMLSGFEQNLYKLIKSEQE